MTTNTPSIYNQYNTISTNSNRGVYVLMISLPMKQLAQKTVISLMLIEVREIYLAK